MYNDAGKVLVLFNAKLDSRQFGGAAVDVAAAKRKADTFFVHCLKRIEGGGVHWSSFERILVVLCPPS